jgi:ABC-type transport system involved in cytochrome c biogenesis permease subunit
MQLILRVIMLIRGYKVLEKTGLILTAMVIVLLFLTAAVRTYKLKFIAVTSLFETIIFFCLFIAIVHLILQIRHRLPAAFHFIITLVLFSLMAFASSPIIPKDIRPLIPALQSYWLVLHVTFSIIGESFFTGAFVVSIVYLVRYRKEGKNLELLENLQYRLIIVGYPIFTVGALVFGAIWAKYAWGGYWTWDPKETWALISWLIFTSYFHVRRLPKWRGSGAAWYTIVGWISLIFTFFGVNFLLSGLHSY